MAALKKDRNTPQRMGDRLVLQVAENTTIYAGSLVAVNAEGYAVPASAATTLTAAGRAEHQVINSGSDTTESIIVLRGVFKFENLSSDAVSKVFSTCYMVDDQTVAATDGGGTRSIAGKVLDIEPDGVWVEIK